MNILLESTFAGYILRSTFEDFIFKAFFGHRHSQMSPISWYNKLKCVSDNYKASESGLPLWHWSDQQWSWWDPVHHPTSQQSQYQEMNAFPISYPRIKQQHSPSLHILLLKPETDYPSTQLLLHDPTQNQH